MSADIFLAFPQEITDPNLLERYDALMTAEERAAERRFVFAHDRHRHRVTRALVRSVLGEQLSVAPNEVAFVANDYGRPELAMPDCANAEALSFNLTHTRDAIGLAVSRNGVVGIDLEDHLRGGESVAIARRFFSPLEVDGLLAVSPARQRERFFRIWTLKEAYIKARGLGLSLPLDSFGFTFGEGEPGLWRDEPRCRDEIDRWAFQLFAPTERHCMALAIGDPPDPLTVRVFRTIPLVTREETTLVRLV